VPSEPEKPSIEKLVSAGLLASGDLLVWSKKASPILMEAVVQPSGLLKTKDGKLHRTPSGAARWLIGRPVDGWLVWRLQRNGLLLHDIRDLYLSSLSQ
jgi:hypothetical protein